MSTLSAASLQEFITSKMKMDHIYQPVIIKSLLQHKGPVSIEQLAKIMQTYAPEETLEYYIRYLAKEPRKALQTHNIASYENKQYFLNLDFQHLLGIDRKHLIKLCEEKIQQFLTQKRQHQLSPPNLNQALSDVTQAIQAAGYHFKPWQIANAVVALKTKPFAILAGISGTGKSQLPRLLGELTQAQVHLLPVRPDWTDSSELLGYTNLQERFVPGRLLELAALAQAEPERTHICLLDEMNLARVEQYFAELLSLMEDRQGQSDKGYASRNPLSWQRPEVYLPENLLIIGTVNMDETTHGFSKKVLDRAFTLEMSDVDLSQWQRPAAESVAEAATPAFWPRAFWRPRALRLSELQDLSTAEQNQIQASIALLEDVNRCLQPAQLQVGYRVRDEFCLYVLHAEPLRAHFYSTSLQQPVDPLDLALSMKILPRIQGSALALQRVLQTLLQLLLGKNSEADAVLRAWQAAERPLHWSEARYPRSAARLLNMLERYQSEGFTSYWL